MCYNSFVEGEFPQELRMYLAMFRATIFFSFPVTLRMHVPTFYFLFSRDFATSRAHKFLFRGKIPPLLPSTTANFFFSDPQIYDIYMRANFRFTNTGNSPGNPDHKKRRNSTARRVVSTLKRTTSQAKLSKESKENLNSITINTPTVILSDRKLKKYRKARPKVELTVGVCRRSEGVKE